MTVRQAAAFVRRHGVVLESARGSAPSLAAHVVGGPIRGSWWGHPRGHEIFRLTRAVRASPDVLVCRLIGGRITYVHRRLWPALACVADRLPASRVARVVERHTAGGRHESRDEPFPRWAPPAVRREAAKVDVDDAMRALGLR